MLYLRLCACGWSRGPTIHLESFCLQKHLEAVVESCHLTKLCRFLYVVVSDACSDYTSSDSENNAWKPIWMTHGESRSSMTKPFALKIARLACRIRKDLILLIEQPSFSCLLGHLRCQCWLSLQKSGKCSLEHIIRFYYLELYRYY